jgi:hypothetical protein
MWVAQQGTFFFHRRYLERGIACSHYSGDWPDGVFRTDGRLFINARKASTLAERLPGFASLGPGEIVAPNLFEHAALLRVRSNPNQESRPGYGDVAVAGLVDLRHEVAGRRHHQVGPTGFQIEIMLLGGLVFANLNHEALRRPVRDAEGRGRDALGTPRSASGRGSDGCAALSRRSTGST